MQPFHAFQLIQRDLSDRSLFQKLGFEAWVCLAHSSINFRSLYYRGLMQQILLNTEASHPMLGNLLEERYQIIQVLSTGTFGRKYIAEDTLSPGNPKCVIKHLKPVSNDQNLWQTVRRQFINKTHNLKRLGEHDRIPEVLAYLENDRGFYLVREFIPGKQLSTLLPTSPRCGKRWKQCQVVDLLQEVLSILEFVHAQGFIHCNIKPNNIIKRASDGKLCAIGFDSIQPVQTPSVNLPEKQDVFSLPPAGYIAPEQLAYQPQPSSDIFALGAIAIQALSGLHPAQLQANPNAQKWYEQVRVIDPLITILNQMVSYQCQDRYQSATEALEAIESLVADSQESQVCSEHLQVTVNQLENEPPDTGSISEEMPSITLTPIEDTVEELPSTNGNSEVPDNGLGRFDPTSSQEESEVVGDDLATLASISEEMSDIPLNPLPKDGDEIVDLMESSPSQTSLDSIAFTTPEIEFFQSNDATEVKEEAPEASANSQKNKLGSKSRKLPAMLAAFGVGMAANALVMVAGLFYISQPDQSKFKQVEQFVNQVQIEEGAKKVCQIPHICFWQKTEPTTQQGKVQTKDEVHQALQEAFKYAGKREFATALKQLEAISPKAPGYDKVKTKIIEYRQKQQVKEQVEKMTKSTGDTRRASR